MVTENTLQMEEPQKPEHLIYSDVKHIIAIFLTEQPEVFAEDKESYEFAYEGYQLTIAREFVDRMRHKLAHHADADVREMFKEWKPIPEG